MPSLEQTRNQNKKPKGIQFNMKPTQIHNIKQTLTLVITGAIVVLLSIFIAYFATFLIVWYAPRASVESIEGLTWENSGLESEGTIYFEVNNIFSDGRPGTIQNYLGVIDTRTDTASLQRLTGMILQHEPQPNGYTSYYQLDPFTFNAQEWGMQWAGIQLSTGGHYVVRDASGRVDDIVTHSNMIDLHDFQITPEGTYLYMMADIENTYMDASVTCIMDCGMFGQSVVEQTPQGSEIYRYDLLDYYTRDDFVMDDIFQWGDTVLYDLTHANSSRLSADGQAIVVSVRHTNEVLVINRANGSLLWRTNDYTFIDDPLNGFDHQHDAQILNNGDLLLFDNGNESGITRAVRYRPNHEDQTLTLVWEQRHPDEHNQTNMGGVRQLPSGEYLINWVRGDADIQVFSAEGDVLYSIDLPELTASYRAGWRPYEGGSP